MTSHQPQPIELYLGFDKRFFGGRIREGIINEADRSGYVSRYQKLLQDNKETINAILMNEEEPESLAKNVYEEMRELAEHEIKESGILRREDNSCGAIKMKEIDLYHAAGIKELDKYQSGLTSSRIFAHLVRLIFPAEYGQLKSYDKSEYGLADVEIKNSACEEFGKDYLKYVSSLEIEDYILGFKINAHTIGGEGYGIALFWSMAPYIHQDLMYRGCSAMESMTKIFDWVLDAEEKLENKGFILEYKELKYADFERFGIESIPFRKLPHLNYDERMPSHLLARLLAKVVARELAKE